MVEGKTLVTLTPLSEALWLSMVRASGAAGVAALAGPPLPSPAAAAERPPLRGWRAGPIRACWTHPPSSAQIMSACAGFLAVNVVLGALWIIRRQHPGPGKRRLQ